MCWKMEVMFTKTKITDDTVFDFWYSAKAAEELGRDKNKIEGKTYSERIITGKAPILSKRYDDLILVHTGKINYSN